MCVNGWIRGLGERVTETLDLSSVRAGARRLLCWAGGRRVCCVFFLPPGCQGRRKRAAQQAERRGPCGVQGVVTKALLAAVKQDWLPGGLVLKLKLLILLSSESPSIFL